MKESVNVWEEDILLPTYGIGRPEKTRCSWRNVSTREAVESYIRIRSSRKIEDTCEEKSYHAVWLENEYIKVMILPELGGRIQMAFDKGKATAFYLLQSRNKAGTGRTHRSLDLRRH